MNALKLLLAAALLLSVSAARLYAADEAAVAEACKTECEGKTGKDLMKCAHKAPKDSECHKAAAAHHHKGGKMDGMDKMDKGEKKPMDEAAPAPEAK